MKDSQQQTAVLTLLLNGEAAKSEINDLKNKADELKTKIEAASQAGDTKKVKEYQKELAKTNQTVRSLQTDVVHVTQVLNNLSAAKPKELRATLSALNRQLQFSDLKRGSAEWNRLQDAVRQVKQEIKNVAAETAIAESGMSRLSNGFNKYFAMASAWIAGLTGLTLSARKAVDEFAKLKESEADIIKYTGLSQKEVQKLGDELKKWDTRTSRIELNALIADAGRLGIQSKKDLLDFAEAGNILNISLGKDLGEGAVKSIGKLAKMFGNSDAMGLKEAMLAVGSAINEVAQNSSASEIYLLNFSNRLSGVANQAQMTIAQIIGLGSVLDQNAQQVEMSATALSGLIQKLYQDPAKFAKIAGLEIQQFTETLRKNANEALLDFLGKLEEKGGMADLAPLFNEMGLEGVRASSVLSVLAKNIEQIKKEQQTAAQAFNEGTSVINEYAVKNNTLQAQIEKAKKKFQELVYELGEQLAPRMGSVITLGGSMVKMLLILVHFLTDYGKQMLWLAGAVAAYNLALKAQNAWIAANNALLALQNNLSRIVRVNRMQEIILTKENAGAQIIFNNALQKQNILVKASVAAAALFSAAKAFLTGNTVRAAMAMQTFNTVVKANPLAALASVVVSAAAGLTFLYQKLKANAEKMQEYSVTLQQTSEATRQYTEAVHKEQTALNSLVQAIVHTNKDSQLRENLIARLKKEYPDFLSYIHSEKISNEKLLAILRLVNQEYDKRSQLGQLKGRIDAYQGAVNKAYQRQVEIEDELLNPKANTKKLEKEYNDLEKINQVHLEKMSALQIQYTQQEAKINEENSYKGMVKQRQLKDREIEEAQNRLIVLRQAQYDENSPQIQSVKTVLDELNGEYEVLTEKIDHKWMELEEKKKKELEEKNKNNNTGAGNAEKKDTATQQRQRLNDELKKLETGHLEEIAQIKRRYLDGNIQSEYEYQQALLSQEDRFDEERKKKIQELLKSGLTDPSVRIEASNQIAEIDKKNLERLIQQASKIKKILLEADPLEAERQSHENRLRELGLFGLRVEEMTHERQEAFALLEKQHQENLQKIDAKGVREKLEALEAEQAQEEAGLAEERKNGLMTEGAYQEKLLLLHKEYLNKKLALPGLSGVQTEKTNKDLSQKEAELADWKTKQRQEAENRYRLVSLKEHRRKELEIIADFEARGVLTHREAAEAKKQIDQEYLDDLTGKMKFVNDQIQSVASNMANAVAGFQEAEAMSVERKYDQQIKSAGKNEKQVKLLEEKKQEELNKIKAEYADKQFIVTTAQIVSSTAAAAMEAYKAMAGIHIVGPFLGAAAAAAAVVYGASQIAVAKEQREAAKAGYAAGGYTPAGRWDEPQGIVHSGEFVANRQAVQNPAARKVFNLLDQAQKNNTVSSLTEKDFARALDYREAQDRSTVSRFSDLLSSSSNQEEERQTLDALIGFLSLNAEVNERLKKRLDEPLHTINTVTGKEGMKQAFDLYERIQKNKSRPS